MSAATPNAVAPLLLDGSASSRWRHVINEAVRLCGTPCYVTRVRPILEALSELESGQPDVRCWLSFKTHPLPDLLDWWQRSGRGVEVVSEMELATALARGCPVDRLLVNGVAKHSWLTRYPVRHLRVHFDSVSEMEALLPLALSCDWRVGVRVHVPDECDRRDPRYGGQFGMSAEEAVASLTCLRENCADLQSVHFHLGQRPHEDDEYSRAVVYVREICDAACFRPRFVDCGGGLPAPSAARGALGSLRRAITLVRDVFQPELQEVWLENGRFVTDESSVLAVRVLDVKERPECRYVICDGGRTNHALAADHGLHPMLRVPDRRGPRRLTTICGPTCMTDDTLARIDLDGDVRPGDILVWMNAGAYHLPWETRFSHGLCAVAWCDETERVTVSRQRERVSRVLPGVGHGRQIEPF